MLSAIHLTIGELRWVYKTPNPLVGAVLATAGNLIFIGESNCQLDDIDATNGGILWRARTDSRLNAAPMTYGIDDMQYVAVVMGRNQILELVVVINCGITNWRNRFDEFPYSIWVRLYIRKNF